MAVISAVLNNRQHVMRNWLKQQATCYAELKKRATCYAKLKTTGNNGQSWKEQARYDKIVKLTLAHLILKWYAGVHGHMIYIIHVYRTYILRPSVATCMHGDATFSVALFGHPHA